MRPRRARNPADDGPPTPNSTARNAETSKICIQEGKRRSSSRFPRTDTIEDLRRRLDTATAQLGEALQQVRLLTDQRTVPAILAPVATRIERAILPSLKGAGLMTALKIDRVRVASRGDAGFSELVSALPNGVDKCLCCGRPAGHRSPDWIAMVLVADESDDHPLAVYSTVCLPCSAVQPRDQILSEWAQELFELYGGTVMLDVHVPGRA